MLIIFHWVINNDTCALTIIESWISGKPSDQTFIGRIVKPIYNIKDTQITYITLILLLIAMIRLMKK